METLYRHTQIGRVTLGALGVPALAAIAWLLRAPHPAAVAMLAFFGCLLVLFSTLTVVVRDQVLDVSFGPGLIRRRIPLPHIREARVVSNPWYYGWGIRLTPSGWLWNVSGLGGVELQLSDGQRFRIGSDEPDALAAVLRGETQDV